MEVHSRNRYLII